jgi:hypothetical protein
MYGRRRRLYSAAAQVFQALSLSTIAGKSRLQINVAAIVLIAPKGVEYAESNCQRCCVGAPQIKNSTGPFCISLSIPSGHFLAISHHDDKIPEQNFIYFAIG